MKSGQSLAVKNITKRPGRSAALIVLSLFLAFSVFCGTLTVSSLRTGLTSLQARLGADIMVVPYEASTKSELEDIVLQGNPGYFYMDRSFLDKVKSIEGVGEATPQFYLASAKSGCCSLPVQIIGIDPDTDFTISPWIKKSYGREPGYMEAVVGNDLNAFVGEKITLYDTDVNVVSKLDKTGTYLDTAVFTNDDTIRALIKASIEKKLNNFGDIDPANVISCIMVNVKDGYDKEEVLNNINLHVKKTKAVMTKNMISGIASGLDGVSDIIGVLIVAVWVLALVIMVIVYIVSINGRKKEFAILRVVGASKKKVASILIAESLITGLSGGIAGIIAGALVIFPFGKVIENRLNLPFLTPPFATVAAVALLSIAGALACGVITNAVSAFRINRQDAGTILREGN